MSFGNFTQAQPAVWAANLGDSLIVAETVTQTRSKILDLGVANTKVEGSAAEATGQAAKEAKSNDSTSTWLGAIGDITQGSTTIGGELFSYGISYLSTKNEIHETTANLKNLNEQQKLLDEIEKNPNTGRTIKPNSSLLTDAEKAALTPAEQQERITAVKKERAQEAEKISNQLKTKELKGKFVEEMRSELETAQGGLCEKEYAEFKEKISNQQQNLQQNLAKLEDRKTMLHNRLSTAFGGTGQIGRGVANYYQSKNQADGAAIQYWQQIANFFSEVTKSLQQQIIGTGDQLFNLMAQVSDTLISKVAETNK